MEIILSTPKTRTPLLVYGILLVLVQPVFSAAHYMWNLDRGAYPPDADSIGIPIIGEWIAWFFLAPLAILLVVLALKKYNSTIPLFGRKSFAPRLLVTNIMFGLLIGLSLLTLDEFFAYANVPVLIDVVLIVYLLLSLRAVVTAERGLFDKKKMKF